VIEELLPGRRFTSAEWSTVVPQLAQGLIEIWLGGSVSRVPARDAVSRSVVRSFGALLDDDDEAVAGRGHLAERVERLRESHQDILYGWCHGDPIRNNWLKLSDGRPALVDWELAGRRPFGHDAMRLLVGLSDPLRVVEGTAAQLEAVSRSQYRSPCGWPRGRRIVIARREPAGAPPTSASCDYALTYSSSSPARSDGYIER
jgi:hypothetical protein